MFDFALAASFLLSAGLAVYLFTVILGNQLPNAQAFTPLSYLKNKLNGLQSTLYRQFSTTHAILAVQELFNLLYSLLDLLPIFLSMLSMAFLNRKAFLFTAFLFLIGFFLMNNTEVVLESVEGFYTCVLSPFLNTYVFVFLEFINLFYAAIVPVYNLLIVIIRQFIVGSFLVLTKCQTSTLTIVNFVSTMVEIFTTAIAEVLRFAGITGGVSGNNNIIVNEFQWNAVVKPLRVMLQFIPESLACLCSGNSNWLSYIYRFVFYPLFTDEIDYIIEHFLNHFILFGQTIVAILPPFLSYPHFSFFHLVSLCIQLGSLFDKWSVLFFELVMQLFRIGGFNLIVEVPSVFIFSAFGRFGAFIFVFLETLLSSIQHLLMPFAEEPLTNQVYMANVFSMKKAMSYWDQFLVALFSSFSFLLNTLLKTFVLVTAMGTNGCRQFPGSCHYYIGGTCAVYCQSKNTIVFKETPLVCNYNPNANARYLHNLGAIEELDEKVFTALDSFQDGFVKLSNTRACLLDWDESYTYRYGDFVRYGEQAYVCTSARCFHTSLQPNTPTSSCSSIGVTCWERIAYGDDALSACPSILNSTMDSMSLDGCQQWCNETKACKSYQHFDRSKYSSERETVNRRCSTDPTLRNYMKCDFESCTLYSENFDSTKLYITKNRRPTVNTRNPLKLAFVYAEEGSEIRNETYGLYCKFKEEESVFCMSMVDNVGVDYVDQFEPYKGYKDGSYYTVGYKTDQFTTEQEVYLPLERQLLAVAVKKNKHARYTFLFSRRNPRNETEIVGQPIEGEEVPEERFQLGIVRDTYQELITPKDSFDVNTFVSCTSLSGFRAVGNLYLILYEFLNELLWNIVSGEEIADSQVQSSVFQSVGEDLFLVRIFTLFYKYDGPPYSRDEESPCNPALPLQVERMAIDLYKENAYYDPYCGRNPNMQSHFYGNWDKTLFFATSVLEKNTFGKLAFNLLRMIPEFYRIGTRMFLDMQTFRVFERLALKPLGCAYEYEDGKIGDCTPISNSTTGDTIKPPCPLGFPNKDCTCRFDDNDLDYNTECACVWLVSEEGIDTDLESQTSIAMSHWCAVNSYDWLLIYVARVSDALVRIIDSLQTGAVKFPVSPDRCLVDETNRYRRNGLKYTLFSESILDRVFGGVVVRNFNQNTQYSCSIDAHHDGACSMASILDRIVQIVLNLVRKLWRNAGAFISFEEDAIDVDISQAICDVQRLEAGLSSTITEIGFAKESKAVKKGITSVIYSFFDIIGVIFSEIHLAMLFIRSFLKGDESIIEGGYMGTDETQNMVAVSSMSTIFYASLTKFVVILFSFLRQLLISMSRIGSASFFLSLVQISDFLESMVTSGIIPVLSSTMYLGIKFLGMIFTPHLIKANDIQEIITQFLDLLAQVITLLLTQAMTILSMVLRLMGAFGTMIGSLLKVVCSVQDVFVTVFNFFGASWDKMDCSALPSFRRRTLAEKEITMMVYEQFDWSGDSFCDRFITAHREWKVEDLRPMEALRFQECVEWKVLTVQVINATGLRSLPEDLLYNWKAPIVLGSQIVKAGIVYAKWMLNDNRNVGALKQELDAMGLNPDDVLHTVHVIKKAFSKTVTRENLNTLMLNVFQHNDPSYMDKNSNSSTRKVFQVYSAFSNSLGGIYDIVSSEKFSKDLESTKQFQFPSVNSSSFQLPSMSHVFSNKALQLTKQVKDMHHTFGRVYSSLECTQTQEDSIMCFECSLLDNFLYSSFSVVERVGDFFNRDFVTDFLIPFNQTWNSATSSSSRYSRAYKSAEREQEERYGGTTSPDEWLEYTSGLFVHRNRSLNELYLSVSYWFQGNYTGEIPSNASLLLPGDFQASIEYPFQADCTTSSFLWEEKLRSPLYGLLPGAVLFVLFELLSFFVVDLPLYIRLFGYTGIGIVGTLAYPVVVYQYNLFCFPQVPLYLIRDILDYLQETLFLSCSCQWFPFLSKACTQQTCYTCSADEPPTYYSCMDEATGMKELGLLWHMLFAVRAYFPEALAFFGTLQLFPFTFLEDVDGLNLLIRQAIDQEKVKGLDLDCFYVSIFLPIAELFAGVLLFMLIAPLFRWALEVVRHALLFIFHLFVSLLYLAFAVRN